MRRRLLAAEAVVLLLIASILLKLMPFRQIAGMAGRGVGRSATTVQARRVAWAIDAAARRVPWRAMCFERGLAARAMLWRRGLAATLYYGAALDGAAGVVAHVWVRSGEVDVVGCEGLDRYGVLAAFPRR